MTIYPMVRAAAALVLCLTLTPHAFAAILSYDREELPGGAVLLVKESHELPIVIIRASFQGGSRYEPVEKQGLANLTARMLPRGTQNRTASAIERLNDLLGGGAGTAAGRDFSTASIRLLTRDLKRGLVLFADVLRRPIFPRKELKKMKAQLLGSLQRKKDRPGYLADKAFRNRLFGLHPYGRQVEGLPETIRKVNQRDLVNFHRNRYGMKGAIFVFVGDITITRARNEVLDHFRDWKTQMDPPPEVFASAVDTGEKMSIIKIERPFKQSTIILGNRSLSRRHKDFYAARVMNYILGGGGFESRLMSNIREKMGLVYSIYSYFAAGMDTGHWRLMLKTKNSSANQAISKSIAEIQRIQEDGVSERELQEAKAFITGNFATRFQSSSRIADYIMAVERLGFPPDYAEKYLDIIRAVTKEQVQAAAKTHINLDTSILTVVGNLDEAKLKY